MTSSWKWKLGLHDVRGSIYKNVTPWLYKAIKQNLRPIGISRIQLSQFIGES